MVNLASLPDPLGFVLGVVAQAAPDAAGDPVIGYIISVLGGAGMSTALLWKIHAEDRKTIGQLTSRLFILADRGMQVGTKAAEVVAGDATDPRLIEAVEHLSALIEERGGSG